MTNDQVSDVIARLEAENEALPLEKEALEAQLERLSNFVHSNHQLRIDLKFSLVQLYGRDRLDCQKLLSEEAEKKLRVCKDVTNR